MGLYRYRIMSPGSLSKAETIVESRSQAEMQIPHGEGRIVKRYMGAKRLATYRVDRDMRGACRWQQMSNQ